MKLAIACDHAGFEMKESLKAFLSAQGHQLEDFGTHNTNSMDYPDVAHPLSSSVESGKNELGILICGSGNGVAMTANKHAGIRAALCWNNELSGLARSHNNANVLCLPARFIDLATAEEMCQTFIQTPFEGGRHANRVQKISC